MKKFFMLLLCMGMAACGFAYYQSTLALSAREPAPDGLGIEQTISDQAGNPLSQVALFPGSTQDHVVRVTNRGNTPCFFRTYIAFENSGDLFDRFISIAWTGIAATPLTEDLVIPGDTRASQYRVYVLASETPLAPGHSVELMRSLFINTKATTEDIRAAGEGYSIFAGTEAVWLPEPNHEEYLYILEQNLNLLGQPTLQHALEVLVPAQTEP